MMKAIKYTIGVVAIESSKTATKYNCVQMNKCEVYHYYLAFVSFLNRYQATASGSATPMDFTVESLHTTEKKLNSEMVRLMKAVNVSYVAE